MKLIPSEEQGGWLTVVVFSVWIVNGILVTYLLMSNDSIINGQLYGFGLQFSQKWAEPYWISLNLIYVLLALPLVLSIMIFGYALIKIKKHQFSHVIDNERSL